MSASLIRTEAPNDGQLHLVIDNPSARNGLTYESARELGDIVKRAGDDSAVRCIVIRGAGEHFCSGADLRAGAIVFQKGREAFRSAIDEGFHHALRAVFECPKPTLAVIRGAAVGIGFDLALACDLRLVAFEANLGQVFTRIGLVPDGGSSFTLPRLVGLGKALELMLLAEPFDGREAERIGLVNRAVPDGDLDALAASWATKLAAGPPIAYRLGKANLRAGAAGGDFSAALGRELEAQLVCAYSKDSLAGVSAFFLKQPPKFEGK